MRSDGNAIRDLRKKRGLTLRQLGDLVGCESGYLSRLERGVVTDPSDERIAQIARALGVSESRITADENTSTVTADSPAAQRPESPASLPELDDNRYYTLQEAAPYTPFGARTLRRKAAQREIAHATANGKRILFRAEHIRAIQASCEVPVYQHRGA
ncbi:helix-turn-helix domain-containing protein [Streptomyces sp. NPDC088354]|uniref:helix-turn-helix domain-containing protein n=1 Tax=Streptomyces sp. NPDC088354 TaxID=3365856 RepID=UPI00381ED16E